MTRGISPFSRSREKAASATQTDLARRLFAHFESHEDAGRESEIHEPLEGSPPPRPVESDGRAIDRPEPQSSLRKPGAPPSPRPPM